MLVYINYSLLIKETWPKKRLPLKGIQDVEHTSPVSDENATTKYARDVEHTSPVSDENATTKYARDVEHTSPVSDENATTKYARDVEHTSPVSDENATTKYAKESPLHALKSSNHKRHNEMAIDETINSYKNHVERHFADFTNQQKISVLEKLLEIFGRDSVEINMNYFKDKY